MSDLQGVPERVPGSAAAIEAYVKNGAAPINEVLKPANLHSDLEIVGELRKWATIYRGTYGAQVCTQAADEIERLRRAGSEVETALDATRRTLAMVLAKNGGCEWITDRQRRSFSYEYLEEEHDAEDGVLTVRVKGDSFD